LTKTKIERALMLNNASMRNVAAAYLHVADAPTERRLSPRLQREQISTDIR
jgi:hypothetical protein